MNSKSYAAHKLQVLKEILPPSYQKRVSTLPGKQLKIEATSFARITLNVFSVSTIIAVKNATLRLEIMRGLQRVEDYF